jgi:putative acyl-CoA dehydrogenase
MITTHEVTNQAPPLFDYNVYVEDRALGEAVGREGAGWSDDALRALGRRAGSAEVQAWAAAANAHPPVLRTHDGVGRRIDEVEFHGAWHALMREAVAAGLHAAPWSEPVAGAHVARAAGFMVWSQTDAGHGCPISMTYAAVPALRHEPAIAAVWEPRLASRVYDASPAPAGSKRGALCGMAMTEKQGGSDVRANTTRARPVAAAGSGQEYILIGHKWFCSAPMCDAFLVLAQAAAGLSCFLLPRWREDGTRNAFFLQRLKDKLGNRSNASSEVEFVDASAWLIGEEGRGVAVIMDMVNHTRLDCVLGSTAAMRQALVHAVHHCRHRQAFGRTLVDHPLMRAVLADLALESEAATVLALRLARAYDSAEASERHFRRMATAVAKFWVCKRAGTMVGEALECLGGNGYVEESVLPRLFRESPVNSVWEGSGNVIALDVLRVLAREPQSVDAFVREIGEAAGADARLDRAAATLRQEIAAAGADQAGARRLIERLALVLQASLLVRFAPPAVADAFCASRLGGDWGRTFGTLPGATDTSAILARAWPAEG